jgi:polysaccharide biosynthesis protein PelB
LSADKRPQLINVHFMVILASLIAAVVLVLAYKADNFEKALDEVHPDALSVAYLKALLQAAPTDQGARLKLARQYLATGAWLPAEQVLKAGGDALMALPQAQWLLLQIQLAQYRATAPAQAQWQPRQQALARRIEALPTTGFTAEQLARLADISLQIGLPREAMGFYARAAADDPQKGLQWYAAAARSALAANQPSRAGDYYRQAQRLAGEGTTAVEMAQAAAGAYQAADQSERALEVIRMALQKHPEDPGLLERGVALALARQQPQRAYAWNRRLLRQRPDDPAALQRQLALALQWGRKEEALVCSRRIVRLAPHDRAMLRRHAELAQWNGRYAEALQTLQTLAADTHDAGVYWKMQAVAQNTYQADTELKALDLLAARSDLTDAQIVQIAGRYEYLGYPERADRLLGAAAPDRAMLTAQTLLRERMGDLQAALESRRQLAARRDRGPDDVLQLARLLWQLGRCPEAYQEVRKLPAGYVPPDEWSALLMGELAWRQGDYNMAATVYRRLWQDRVKTEFARRRMILAYRQLGRTAELVAILEAGWSRTGDGDDLRAAMVEALQAELWPTLGRLLDKAGRTAGPLVATSEYWLLKGDWHSHREEYHLAFQAFRRALDLDPSAAATAADGLLWSLINANDRDQLSFWLEKLAGMGLPPSDGYAAALQVLGRFHEALAWYQQRLAQHRNDALWLLNLADLLDGCGRVDAALHIRQHALKVLMTMPDRIPDDRRVELIAALKGVPGAARWLAGHPDGVSQAALLNWWLQRERFDAARLWLLQHHVRRMQLPGWQQLQLAMNEQDRSAMADLLQRGQLVDPGDRMTAYSFLDRDDLALAEIDSSAELPSGLLSAAAAAAAQLPNYGELSFDTLQSGGLAVMENRARWWTSHGRHGWGLEAGRSAFEASSDTGLTAAPGSESTLNLGWRLRHGGVWDAQAGLRDEGDSMKVPVELGYRSPDGPRWQYRLHLQKDAVSDTGVMLRMLGTTDNLTTALDYRIDSRLSASLRGGLHRYQSLGGSDLAHGQTAGWNLTYYLAQGTCPLSLSVGGAWEHNTVVHELPADLQLMFAAETAPTVLVPESYRDTGLTLHIGRGDLHTDFPQTASPRWFAELWIGNVEPGAGLSVAGRAGLGISLLGSDELGLTAEYDNRLDKTADNNATVRTQISYRYYFGR